MILWRGSLLGCICQLYIFKRIFIIFFKSSINNTNKNIMVKIIYGFKASNCEHTRFRDVFCNSRKKIFSRQIDCILYDGKMREKALQLFLEGAVWLQRKVDCEGKKYPKIELEAILSDLSNKSVNAPSRTVSSLLSA